MVARIRIVFDKKKLFNNAKSIITGIAKSTDKKYTLPNDFNGFFEHELQLVVDSSLSDILRPLLYGEEEPVINQDEVVMVLTIYAVRQKTMLPATLEQYICNSLAYGWFVRNRFGYEVVDMEHYYKKLHHAVLVKDGPYSRRPNF